MKNYLIVIFLFSITLKASAAHLGLARDENISFYLPLAILCIWGLIHFIRKYYPEARLKKREIHIDENETID